MKCAYRRDNLKIELQLIEKAIGVDSNIFSIVRNKILISLARKKQARRKKVLEQVLFRLGKFIKGHFLTSTTLYKLMIGTSLKLRSTSASRSWTRLVSFLRCLS